MIVQKYLVGPYKIIIEKDVKNQQRYCVTTSFDTSPFLSLTNTIEKQITSEKGFLDSRVFKLQSLIDFLKQSIEDKIGTITAISEKNSCHLQEWMIYRIIGLESIMPLLLDDKIQEIYLDKPGTALYIDHQEYGRCITDIRLTKSELNRLKTRFCIEKDVALNRLNPSMKVEVKTNCFHIRATIDMPPLAADGLSMNIRKLRNKIWTLPELIRNNMLSLDAAAYLLFIMKRRNNFTIIGEPGSGKTTLANSIDLLTPPYWRKISVEDVIESIEQTTYNKFHTRYVVAPFETKDNLGTTKSKEIIKLLHRSPNWVYLGEIQTAEHSKALFEALSAGLIGIQTCHGRTIEMMLIRWINQHDIPLSSILSLDLLIEVVSHHDNWQIHRRVSRITELSKASFLKSQIIDSLEEIELVDNSVILETLLCICQLSW
jgi:pilus assembly protein CpaF